MAQHHKGSFQESDGGKAQANPALRAALLKARHRNSRTRPELLKPSNPLARDHRIRPDISPSNFPRFDVNPKTGGPLGEAGGRVIAENTLHYDRTHPPHMVLPIMKPLKGGNHHGIPKVEFRPN